MIIILIEVQSAYSFQLRQDFIAKPSRGIYDSLFNKGNVQEAYGLINNLFSGVLITKAGANIHENFNVRVRGISTISGRTEPLVVINGMIGVPIDAIDINDIESITILKGAETAIYGIQGASGVIEIQTKVGGNQPLELSFNSSVIIEQKIYNQKVRGAESFLALGGNDLGNRIDWLEYITQTGVSTVNNLALSGNKSDFDYRFSVNSRLVNGILKDSGYDLTNFFGHVKWKGLNNKLNVEYIGSFTSRESDVGFSQAFKYAFDANPTMPKYFQSGDVYQAIQFDAYNPVGFFDLASKTSKSQIMMHGLRFQYNLNAYKINLGLNISDQTFSEYTNVDPAFFYSSAILQNAYFQSQSNQNLNFGIERNLTIGTTKIDLSVGFKNQSLDLKSSNQRRSIIVNGLTSTEKTDNAEIRFNTGFFGANIKHDDWAFLNLFTNRDNSNVLGDNIKPGLFYFLHGGFDLLKKKGKPSSLLISASIGKSGLSPYRDDINVASIFSSNDVLVNPDLSYEVANNSEITAAYVPQNQAWSISLTRFKKSMTGLIREFGVQVEDDFFRNNKNADALDNSGWEIDLSWTKRFSKYRILSNLNLTTLKTEWTKIEGEPYTLGYVGCGCSGVGVIRYEQGLPFGAVHGPVFQGIAPDGDFLLIDQNDDGFNTQEDFIVHGQVLPKAMIGWRSEIARQNTKLSFQLDATLGHNLANFLRFERSANNAGITATTNTLEDNLGIESSFNLWSDVFVEDASYLRLVYVHISHEFTFKNVNLVGGLTANNLFTISNYSGDDRSVRLAYDYGRGERYNIPGIQSMNEWFPSRSFTFSIAAKF